MNYKVGQRVEIRKNNKSFNEYCYAEDMEELEGQVFQIVARHDSRSDCFLINETEFYSHYWHSNWLKPFGDEQEELE